MTSPEDLQQALGMGGGASPPPGGPPQIDPQAPLPRLREDLNLFPGAPLADGLPSWIIHDPARNRFFTIGWLEFELLSRWPLGSGQAVLTSIARQTPLEASVEELSALVMFLDSQQLLAAHDSASVQKLVKRAEAQQVSPAKQLLHTYLFLRFPLWHPGPFLRFFAPWVAFVTQRTTVIAVLLLSLLGLILAGRQWDHFVSSFHASFTPAGVLGFAVATAVAKSLHELGHAFTAQRYGVRVAHMGVALVVMFPMLYTDTGETWKLVDRRQRFHIAAAGILTELALAGLATLAWALAPEGALRAGLFFLATTSWIMSLAINVSPFMRFDGYFLLSDALDFPNLHERAGALAKCWMRRLLLGWPEPLPEELSPGMMRFLTAFAWFTWGYRLVVFTGIAVTVYAYFFKLLGIFLFLVEIIWFVVLPVWKETVVWYARRAEVLASRRRLGKALLICLLAFGLLPWQGQISAPALGHAEHGQVLYSPLAAQIRSYTPGEGAVLAEAPLFVLDAPNLRAAAETARQSAAALSEQLAQLAGQAQGEEKRTIIADTLAQREAEVEAYAAEQARLVLRAPLAGWLVDLDPSVQTGVWVNSGQALGTVIDPAAWVADAWVAQEDRERVSVGDRACFYPHMDRLGATCGTVSEVDSARTTRLPHAALAVEHGGPLATQPGNNGGGAANNLAPLDVLYRVRIHLDQPLQPASQMLGIAVVHGKGKSPLLAAVGHVLAAIIRESGF